MLLILAIEKIHCKNQVIARLFWFCWRRLNFGISYVVNNKIWKCHWHTRWKSFTSKQIQYWKC